MNPEMEYVHKDSQNETNFNKEKLSSLEFNFKIYMEKISSKL